MTSANAPCDELDTGPVREGTVEPDTSGSLVAGRRPLPLENLVVIDLSRVLSGPLATNLLASLGARVVKVEGVSEDTLDPSRLSPPFRSGMSHYFLQMGHTKLSVQIDLKSPEDKHKLIHMIETADVVVENFRPGVATRLGLEYDQLRKANPQLVYCNISGFSARRNDTRGALDLIVQADTGCLHLTEGEDPVRIGIPISDIAAGYHAALGILRAVWDRQKIGHGSKVNIAMDESTKSLLEVLLPAAATGTTLTPDIVRCSDGYLVIERVRDPLSGRHISQNELTRQSFLSQPTGLVLQRLVELGMTCYPVLDVGTVVDNAMKQDSGTLVSVHHPVVGRSTILATPFDMMPMDDHHDTHCAPSTFTHGYRVRIPHSSNHKIFG